MNPCRVIALAGLLAGFAVRADDEAARAHFVSRVKPLLDARCVSCHGLDKQKGGLRMDSRAALLKGGDTGPALVPGKPAASLLIQAVSHTRKELEMPPKEKLTTNDIAVLERWIRDGAPWPETAVASVTSPLKPGEQLGDAWHDPRNPIVKIFGGQRLDLWSLKPVSNPKPPAVQNRRLVRNPIDQFILSRLDAAKLAPAPEADRRTLARRLWFDLIGLPPSPAEMQEFLADQRPDAYERLVDRLLAAPRHGEHQARAWLDVVRYSDSNGFDWDEFRPRAWRFRDYVVRSFNADKPFNQFIREQLAGDELVNGPPKDAAEQDRLIATGYLRLGPHDNSAGAFNEQDRSRAELLADLTETTGSAFLGLTLGCCRCHDHKYDPLSQADHFRLRAFFEPVKFADDLPLDLAAEQEAIRRKNQAVEEKIKRAEDGRAALLAPLKARLREERMAKLTPVEAELLKLPKEKRPAEAKKQIEEIEKKLEPDEKELKAGLTPEQTAARDEFTKQIDEIKKQKVAFTLGLLMTDADGKPPVTKILFQGNHKDPRAPVEPGFISVLYPNPATIRAGANPKTTGRRLALAEWIASPENPLTARVLVNRVWQSHFGRGLVATPNDFGLAGARPTHPELLDWLSSEFVRDGWSVKRLHRLIVTSAAYRSSSVLSQKLTSPKAAHTVLLSTDGLSTDYSRQTIRRLSAEQLRDALLAVSGTLLAREGGPPVWPELPAEILQANPAFLDDNETKTKGWYPSPATNQNVRSLFLIQKKTVHVPFMETFDLPENSTSCPRRHESIVAPQALTLMNGAQAVAAARALAERVKRAAGADTGAQVARAFAFAYQRAPGPAEHGACLKFLRQHSLTELCRALLNANEFIYVD